VVRSSDGFQPLTKLAAKSHDYEGVVTSLNGRSDGFQPLTKHRG
jgi:hypothetical protein